MVHFKIIAATVAVTAFLATAVSLAAPPLRYLTTAHQGGPVGYRDPIGAVSPDGVWLAYAANRHLFLHRIDGSLTTELLPAEDLKIDVSWSADSTHLTVIEEPYNSTLRWYRYDIATGKREAFQPAAIPVRQEQVPRSIKEMIWGPSVFSADHKTFYYSVANAKGTLDLWSCNTTTGEATQLTHFDRDTYAPSITTRGDVVFKSQVFSANLATAPAAGGASRVLSAFQAETPTWSPDGKTIAFTFGRWRRFINDALYPNIEQHLGIMPFDADTAVAEPSRTVQASKSEDQGMVWSPNGKWLAFHSHRDKQDDLYLQRADGSDAARQITIGGHETNWPRWSPDGHWIAFSTYAGSRKETRSRLFVMGIDQDTGQVTQPATPLTIEGQTETAGDPNWMPDSEHLVFDSYGAVTSKKSLIEISRLGGRPRKIIDYTSDQMFSGISASPDGKWVAYVAYGPDGVYQIFRVPTAGGQPEQITTDPNQKTQPAYSPDGKLIAFTIWRYDEHFWMMPAEQ